MRGTSGATDSLFAKVIFLVFFKWFWHSPGEYSMFSYWVPESSLAGFLWGRKSVILGVWAAPGAR